MTDEFSEIDSVDGWAEKLDELLTEADEAAESGDGDTRRAIRTRLKDFVLSSRPNSPEIRKFDRIASEARTGMALASIDERVHAIAERSGELARITKEFQTRAEEGRSGARLLALEPARNAVTTATAAIHALKELEGELSVVENESLLKKLSRVLSGLQALRTEIESG